MDWKLRRWDSVERGAGVRWVGARGSAANVVGCMTGGWEKMGDFPACWHEHYGELT